MKVRRISSTKELGRGWQFIAEDYDYGLFEDKKPKEVALELIRMALGDKCEKYDFAYVAKRYRGHQSMKDTIDVYIHGLKK